MKKRSANIVIMILLIIITIEVPINIILLSHNPSRIETEERSQAFKVEMSQLSLANTWPSNGRSICVESYDQRYPKICSDGAGGAIITWEDERSGTFGDIYVQLVNSTGDVKWVLNGVAISTYNKSQGAPQISSDGVGGAVITWHDKRNGINPDIYAQRINSTGDVKWIVNGTAISTADDDQVVPQICSDEAGGAIIIWNDYRSGANYDIYAQRINSSGNVKWITNGTAICIEGGDQYFPQICSDGAGGAIIVWEDLRGSDSDIYAQYINSTGHVKWNSNGRAICTANNTQWYTQICSDGAGGVIITWADYRNGTNFDIFAQRVDSTGNVKWSANGTVICEANGDQETPQICSDGAGGALITWEDLRSGSNGDIYAQRINSTGNVKWTANGVAICTINDDQDAPQICSDGNGGAIITWEDLRSVWEDIYAQRINSTGHMKWASDGVVICNAGYAQRQPQICVGENRSTIITWFDKRNGAHYDIYAQLIKDIPFNGDDPPSNGDDGFPFGILLITSSIIGAIAIGTIITVLLLKKRQKIE
ncbi:MAG: hypothetical protein JRI53_12490 [Deltaproteobacteria bacterium]|nr:hypothetical protein [Deltaproteobacteria bacterium]